MLAAQPLSEHSLKTGERTGALLAVLAGLIWPLQAALLAWVMAELLKAPATAPVLIAPMGFAALAVVRALIDVSSQRILAEAADVRIMALRSEIVARESTLSQDSRFGNAGALAAMAAEKLEAVRPWLLRYKPARTKAAVLPLVIFFLALWHSWAVAVVLLAAGPLIPVFMALVGWAAKAASARQMVEVGALSDLLVDRLAALSDFRLIGAGDAVIDGFAAASDSLRDRTMAVLRVAFLSSTVLELFSAIGVAMVAVWVGFSLLGELKWGAWGGALSPIAGIYLLLLAPDYFQPLRDLAAAWHDRAAAEAVLQELQDWRTEDRPLRMGGGATDADLRGAEVYVSGLHFRNRRYPDLTVSPGDSLAIIGSSGSGKTSLLRLLAGLERPDRGAILLNDQMLDDDVAESWRAGIGWMPQAPHFLDRSLRYNIGFGARLDPAVIDAAQLHGVLAALPEGDQTRLGARGAGLSGGEARRITLARALHGAPRLLLADEPTADLDAQTADEIIDSLLAFSAAGGTLMVSTHDPKLIARLDRVIRLDAPLGDSA
ncbi:ABC transporter ATP-binding protein/permease [Pacificoceanicola onchidii]|uniref:ABC transporter ATP-binding protein/permease n=1 Tax=Pacificoceanicola onchidii TaxID=2562685 RepID=UPI0010A3C26C|nr:ATP-binding cassette domain-containing protein [Pacificoceanicola onchidii]